MSRPAHRHRRRAQGVLEHQVPADDPRHELAERHVRIGVGRAGDRHGGGELGIAETRQRADHAGEEHGQDDGGTGVSAGRLAGEHEDAGADDAADADEDQVGPAQNTTQARLARLSLSIRGRSIREPGPLLQPRE